MQLFIFLKEKVNISHFGLWKFMSCFLSPIFFTFSISRCQKEKKKSGKVVISCQTNRGRNISLTILLLWSKFGWYIFMLVSYVIVFYFLHDFPSFWGTGGLWWYPQVIDPRDNQIYLLYAYRHVFMGQDRGWGWVFRGEVGDLGKGVMRR